MSAQLVGYADAYREAQRLVHEVAADLSDEAFNWKPDAKSWSVGECIVHLNTMAEGYLPVLERAAQSDGPRANGPFRYGFVARTFTNAVRPGSRPIPTAGSMKPPAATGRRSEIDKAQALERFDADTERYTAAVEQADGLDLSRISVRSPFLKLLKLPLGAFFDALGQHAIRHAQQAQRVTQQPGFPA